MTSYDHLNFSRAFVVQFYGGSIYYAPELNFRVISYDHLNFSRASVVKFQDSRYNMSLNRTSSCKVITISISRELSLFNSDLLDM